MALQIIETVQQRLQELGYYAGRIDGDGGDMTSRAVVDFKTAHGMAQRDYVGPLTLALLFSDAAKPREHAPGQPPATKPAWYVEGASRLGLNERTDNAELRAWLRSDGATLGDPALSPWCGDFVETCIRRTLPEEPVPENPYLARNWLAFGKECGIVLGAVAVFWRGSRAGTSGHVAFVAGDDATTVHVLGGNQSDGVSITRLGKDRLLGCRWPLSAPMVTTQVTLAATGTISTDEA